MLTTWGFTIIDQNQNVPLACEWTISSPFQPSHLELFQVVQEKEKIYFWNRSENCCSLLFRFIASVELKWKKEFFSWTSLWGIEILRNPNCMIYKCKDTYVYAFQSIFKSLTQSNPLRSVCHFRKQYYLRLYNLKMNVQPISTWWKFYNKNFSLGYKIFFDIFHNESLIIQYDSMKLMNDDITYIVV